MHKLWRKSSIGQLPEVYMVMTLKDRVNFLSTKKYCFGCLKFLNSFHQPMKDERLSQPWNNPVVLNMGPLDWEASALPTRTLLPNIMPGFVIKD